MTVINFRTKEERLRFSEQQSRAWVEHSPACTKVIDLDFNLQYMSSSGVNALHIDDITVYYGKPYPLEFYPKSFRDEMTNSLIKARDSGEVVRQEASVKDIDGNEVWFHSTIVPIREDGEQIDYFMVVSIDTTEQRQANAKLQQVNDELELRVKKRTRELEDANKQLLINSEIDFLTNIPNRRVYTRRVKENIATAKRNEQPLSLLMVDIDHFKYLNDKYGHDYGDVTLQKLAESIQKSLPRKTDLVARFGGEEFVILLPATDATTALKIAESIRVNARSLGILHDVSDTASTMTVSIGISSLQDKYLNETDLFKQADKALYVAKESGRNCCQVFSS